MNNNYHRGYQRFDFVRLRRIKRDEEGKIKINFFATGRKKVDFCESPFSKVIYATEVATPKRVIIIRPFLPLIAIFAFALYGRLILNLNNKNGLGTLETIS